MGAVTTGPVTVPLVISLGNGIAASVRAAHRVNLRRLLTHARRVMCGVSDLEAA
jgi:hypothetical protein